MANRYFTTEIAGGTARIAGDDAAHLARVLRTKPGDVLPLCDGAGRDYTGTVLSASADEVLLQVDGGRPSAGEPSVWCDVYIGLARGERMDLAVQKAVELGASAIWPFESERTIAKPKNPEQKQQRYARIASEAAKQCQRGILPQVGACLSFGQMLQSAKMADKALFFYEEGDLSLARALAGGVPKRLALITGPEGGFSPKETEAANEAGCCTVGLGPRILRCETAPAAALCAVMLLSGNLE